MKMMTKTTLILALLMTGTTVSAQTPEKSINITKNDSTMTKQGVFESIANHTREGYQRIENGVVKGYKAIEEGAVKGFENVSDTMTSRLFGKEGETVEQTKARLKANAEKQK